MDQEQLMILGSEYLGLPHIPIYVLIVINHKDDMVVTN